MKLTHALKMCSVTVKDCGMHRTLHCARFAERRPTLRVRSLKTFRARRIHPSTILGYCTDMDWCNRTTSPLASAEEHRSRSKGLMVARNSHMAGSLAVAEDLVVYTSSGAVLALAWHCGFGLRQRGVVPAAGTFPSYSPPLWKPVARLPEVRFVDSPYNLG